MINQDMVFVIDNKTKCFLYNIPEKQLYRYINRLNSYNVDFLTIFQDSIKKFSILNDQIVEEEIKTQITLITIEFLKITPQLFQKLREGYKFIDFREKYPLNCKKIQHFDLKRFLFFEDYIDKFLDDDIVYGITPRPTEIELNTVFETYKLCKGLKAFFL